MPFIALCHGHSEGVLSLVRKRQGGRTVTVLARFGRLAVCLALCVLALFHAANAGPSATRKRDTAAILTFDRLVVLAAHDVIANRLDLLVRQAGSFRAVQHALGLGYVRRVGIVRRRRLIGGIVNVYAVRGLMQRRARTANAAT